MARKTTFLPDLPLSEVARLLGFDSARAFEAALPDYRMRGFPEPDPITRRVDPEAFERWRRLRHARLFPELTLHTGARDARTIAMERKQWPAR